MDVRSQPIKTAPGADGVPQGQALFFTTRILPWCLPAVMLVIYVMTLNHWIVPDSLGLVSSLEGLTWTPHVAGPVTWLLTRPVAWLPAGSIPLAVNLLMAVCAAVTLGFLARSVALLPHDLSKEPPPPGLDFTPPQLLGSRLAWLPPLFAVLVCGLQLSFWQQAVSATGEMINLLMFAGVIWCFLEYNFRRKDSWLLWAALVDGLAVANDWQMAIFIPFLLVGLLWVKRLHRVDRFIMEQMLERRIRLKLHILWQIPGCWLAGFSFVLLLPLLASLSTSGHMDFWPAVKVTLHSYGALRHLSRQFLMATCLICVVPVFLMGLRYYHFMAGASWAHLIIGLTFFQLVFGFFLLVDLWAMFETPVSPHRLAPNLHTLPFYWLAALSIGYFIGHFLILAQTPDPAWLSERRRYPADEQQRKRMLLVARSLKWGTLGGVVLLVTGVPAALLHKNLHAIASVQANPVTAYFQQVARALPTAGAVVIGPEAAPLAYLQMTLIRNGTQAHYLLLNSTALAENSDYWAFLQRQKHPGFDLNIPLPIQSAAVKLIPLTVLQALSKNHEICCLPPAPVNNFLAEFFYFEPYGLIYHLNQYRDLEAFAPATTPSVWREDEAFWNNFRTGPFTNLVRRINVSQRPPANGLIHRFISTLHTLPEADPGSTKAGALYAVALNDWGVELQRAGQLPDAGKCFADALLLDTNNIPAAINAEFNATSQAGEEMVMQKPLDTAVSLNQYGGWQAVMTEGAVDEPNFCYMLGAVMADNGLYRPAIAQFERVRQLAPTNVDSCVNLAKLFTACHDFGNTQAAADDVLALCPTNETGLFYKASSDVQLGKFQDAVPRLNQLLAEDPTNNLALLNRAIAYRSTYLFDAARRDYAAVIQANPGAFPAYYDLGQMDDAELNFSSAVTNYKLFLQYAPATVLEVPEVQKRLKQLLTASPSQGSSSH
jgi:tetratricopeptide (TPR) repeat protein